MNHIIEQLPTEWRAAASRCRMSTAPRLVADGHRAILLLHAELELHPEETYF